ncbi:MAG: lipopolysaccharide transport periplasmic protein LptA [Pseudooceanicola nanhaiensis]
MTFAFSALRSLAICLALTLPGHALAQGPSLAFGSAGNSDKPVEVEAENLSVSQTDGTAEFLGDVIIRQGDMRLNAPRVLVEYSEDQSKVKRLEATGGVTIVSGEDAAEAEQAEYDLDARTIVMTGDVTIVQGPNTLSSSKMTIDLDAGTAQMDGRVRTILQTGGE